uniref:Uncharacterized protein n=1 Tax=Leersia perrieri TaxID=77586 RepID=A0A0D9WA79_9ORYZ
MAFQSSAAVFLIPASMPMPADGAVVIPASGAFTSPRDARRVVLAAAGGVIVLQPHGGGGGDLTRRRGVVCFQAGGTPSSGDDEPKIKYGVFKAAMDTFEDSLRPLALVNNVKVLKEVKYSAEGCSQLIEISSSFIPITQEQLKELVCAGEAFALLAGECREGYVRATSLVAATNGAKYMCKFSSVYIEFLPMQTATNTTVPVSSEDIDKENYFTELSMEFYSIYQHLRFHLYRHLGISYWQ